MIINNPDVVLPWRPGLGRRPWQVVGQFVEGEVSDQPGAQGGVVALQPPEVEKTYSLDVIFVYVKTYFIRHMKLDRSKKPL